MRSGREVLSFNNKEWLCVSVQSPLGAVTLARRLPPLGTPEAEKRHLAPRVTRQFDLSNHPGLTTRRVRSRR
jgi:hypothetical protein